MRKDIRQAIRYQEFIHKVRHLHASALGTLGFCTRWAVDVHGFGREWIDVVEINLRFKGLARGLSGTRIAHISDLHYSRTVTGPYLRRCIDRINSLDVDIVVLTGDYITYDIQGRYRKKVIGLVGDIRSRLGVFACLGNHDYGLRTLPWRRRKYLLHRLVRGMEAAGVTVLRNKSKRLKVDGHPLWLVGLGDLSVGDFRPHKAFADVPSEETTIVLMHNPHGAEHLDGFAADAIVTGHTHGKRGGFCGVYGPRIMEGRFHAGLHEVDAKKLYVNRGLGRVGRPRLNARPEISVFTLQ
ncbi:MAG: metallophosphoesterase [Planctomycetota bacterium]|jgi:predicted MPP superfamily phosphohydrolase